MNHVEWEDFVTDLHVQLMTAAEATTALRPADPVTTSHVLVLASGGGGALATGGTLAELGKLGEHIRRLCAAAGDGETAVDEHHPAMGRWT